VVGIAILALCGLLLGAAIFGVLWAAVAGVVSLLQDLLAAIPTPHLSRRRPIEALPSATNGEEVLSTAVPDLSAEAMWHQMQGTSKRSSVRRWNGPGKGPAARS
jgi:hypothetical protein